MKFLNLLPLHFQGSESPEKKKIYRSMKFLNGYSRQLSSQFACGFAHGSDPSYFPHGPDRVTSAATTALARDMAAGV